MFNPNLMRDLGKARQNELMEEAKVRRLLKEAQADHPLLHQRLLVHFGDFLVSVGLRLTERSRSVGQPEVGHQLRGDLISSRMSQQRLEPYELEAGACLSVDTPSECRMLSKPQEKELAMCSHAQ